MRRRSMPGGGQVQVEITVEDFRCVGKELGFDPVHGSEPLKVKKEMFSSAVYSGSCVDEFDRNKNRLGTV